MTRHALALLCLLPVAAAAETVTGLPHVVDGDSLRFPGVEVRLEGLDAPEWNQTCRRADGAEYRCGQDATAALRALIAGRPVTCVGVPQPDGTERDRYGRLLGDCRAGDTHLNAAMVEAGWALAYRRYNLRLVPHEDRARAARRGMWQGEFVPPWEYRRERSGR
ncbi:MAG: thermonuclease family protein [Alphaproteobacteria bacterium]|nr:thermonuclease family protein [Alphaproteobacteria bacterium]MCW5739685.1 thermonuclease family protein [Alphaproteobacteria bacterium]